MNRPGLQLIQGGEDGLRALATLSVPAEVQEVTREDGLSKLEILGEFGGAILRIPKPLPFRKGMRVRVVVFEEPDL